VIKRLLLVAAFVLAMPIWLSLDRDGRSNVSVPFSPVAIAGRSISNGLYCQCGCEECICDPGEVPTSCNSLSRAVPEDPASKPDDPGTVDLDYSSGVLMLAIAFMLWTRFKA
jgi:hypothetical protein